MEIVPATLEDAGPLVAVRDGLARWLESRGIAQWIPGEFPARQMRDWIDAGHVHVLRDGGRAVGAVAVLWEDADIWGTDGEDGRAGYVHLLMVDRSRAGQGLGDRLLAHAEGLIRDHDRSLSRLDAVADNEPLHAWYRTRGYLPVRPKTFEGRYAADWYDCLLFEKTL